MDVFECGCDFKVKYRNDKYGRQCLYNVYGYCVYMLVECVCFCVVGKYVDVKEVVGVVWKIFYCYCFV